MLTGIRVAPVAVMLTCSVTAQVDPALDQGLKLLETGRTTLSERQLTDARDYFGRLEKQPSNAIYAFDQTRANQYLCEAFSARGDKKGAERALDAAIDNAQLALRLNEKSADTHTVFSPIFTAARSASGSACLPVRSTARKYKPRTSAPWN